MPPPFDSISKIHPPREAWRLKVRVLRTWIVPSFGNHEVANSMEIVLVDGDSNKIQATVKKQLINRFKESIIEGQTYRMSYFSVVPNQGNYRAAEHEFKLVFLNHTTVIPVPDDDIPKTCFSFCPFDELLKMTEDYVYLVDVISLLTSVGEEKEYVKDAKVMKMIVLELSSKELTIRCALFGEYVDEVHRFLGSGYMEQSVVVIQLAKVKFFRGQVGLQNIMHATRLFFNPDLSEVVDFKNSMIDQGINGTQPLFIANEGKGVSLEDDFMRLTRRCTIDELHDKEEGSFVVFGFVRSIVDEGPWWYSACVCGKSIQPQCGAYYCDFCQHYVTNVTPRYRIKIAVEDDNDMVVCGDSYPVMFQQLVGKKLLLKIDTKSVGADKYFGTFRVRRVCDDVAIISMFELPNYDADDECTPLKDGRLGKIPSTGDEHIVDKREPFEVLYEGITADGNCSTMKTNCKPLIDFIAEKGAVVPGLDDISTEIDILREAGKSVDDSVLVDGECSLEIEGLLNSPPVETTDVLSAVLDGSPVHVIKKENVSNVPRGKKAKRNLKKII
ncbi:hypothetical protein Ahy_A06g026413 [Arachis hypogaea]|uniref:Replication protein A 70 kDa DNA-binding subunit B/D first OB fold domain-containing protein n=1 Tax=Arachis hypogaea TaxID=3818 RepID=A0A445CKH1_ARAHY|nr:hypothetical protein Ahy_A06g026413 [Arachis hypogaea]